MSDPDQIEKIFEMLFRRTMRRGGTKRISIMQFHPEYASDDKENTSTKQDRMFKYDCFQSLNLPEAVELVNLVQETLGKSLVSI